MSDKPTDSPDRPARRLIPFFPDYLTDEVIAWYIALAILVALASLFPAGLEPQADALVTPAHIKPEWYFLFLYQTLKLVPRLVGVILPAIGVLLLFALPFLDRSPDRRPRARIGLIVGGVVLMLVILSLTVWGWLS